MALPGIGRVSYNGLEFDGPMISSKVSIENVRGEDDRAVIYSNVTIEIKATISLGDYSGVACIIHPDDIGSGGYLTITDRIRHMLSQDGKPLIFEDKIFHKFHVNTTFGDGYDLVDVNYGPRTKVGSIVPIMANKAFEVVWSVTAAVGQCPEIIGDGPTGYEVQSWKRDDIKQVCYRVDWSADHRGYTSRTVTGFIEIVSAPALEQPENVITVSADDYRDRLTIHMPKAFRRTENKWSLNEKRDRISFTVVDQECDSPNPYPPGVVAMEVIHKVAIGADSGFTKGVSELSGSCEVANPLPTSEAWEKLYPIIDKRIKAARDAYGGILLTNVSITEYLFARKVSFSISFYKLSASPYGFIKSAGLFTPVSDGNDGWLEWRKSMYGQSETSNDETYERAMPTGGPEETRLPWARRSIANLSYEPSDDKLVTPCTSQPFEVTVHNQRIDPFPNDLQSALKNVCPAPEKSYVKYDNALELVSEQDISCFKEQPIEGTASDTYTKPSTADKEPIPGSQDPDVNRNRMSYSGETIKIWMIGKACRVGVSPEMPEFAKDLIDTKKVVIGKDKSKTSSKKLLGCTVYVRSWKVELTVATELTALLPDLDDLAKKLFKTPVVPEGMEWDEA